MNLVPLDDLKPDPRNPKHHAIGAIEESIRRFGFGAPLVVDDRTGFLASGHGRREALLAMRARGDELPAGVEVGWRVPVVSWRSRDDREAAAFLVAANRLTEQGGWKPIALRDVLDTLGETRLVGIGFDSADLPGIREAAALAASPLPAAPRPPRMLTCPSCGRAFPDSK